MLPFTGDFGPVLFDSSCRVLASSEEELLVQKGVDVDESARFLSAKYGSACKIGAFSFVASGVELGDNVIIHPHCVLYGPAIIGDSVEIFPFAFLGKAPAVSSALHKKFHSDSPCVIGDGTVVSSGAIVYRGSKLGRNCLIGDGASVREQVSVGDSVIIGRHVTIGPEVEIGDGSRIVDFAHITGNTRIGKRVFISTHVCSANDNSFAASNGLSLAGQDICDDVKIGLGAMLLPGVKIGKGAVVAAGAIVCKDVPASSLVLGQPAKFVRKI